MYNRSQRSISNVRPPVVARTAEAKRIAKLYENIDLLEALADRSHPLPASLNLEQILRDLTTVYVSMADRRYPFN